MTLWGSLSPHISVVVPTIHELIFAREVLLESITCHSQDMQLCSLLMNTISN